MKKIQKYNSFEELKFALSSVAAMKDTAIQKEQALADCFNLLRTKIATKQRIVENNLLYEQQLGR